jgi:hypothetical protein
MMHLAAVVTAINELYQRREDVRPEAVRADEGSAPPDSTPSMVMI